MVLEIMRSENSVTKDVGTLDRLMKDGCKQNIYEVFFLVLVFFLNICLAQFTCKQENKVIGNALPLN